VRHGGEDELRPAEFVQLGGGVAGLSVDVMNGA
jgi:hypothetical protein